MRRFGEYIGGALAGAFLAAGICVAIGAMWYLLDALRVHFPLFLSTFFVFCVAGATIGVIAETKWCRKKTAARRQAKTRQRVEEMRREMERSTYLRDNVCPPSEQRH